jgi:hypothetical protein
VPNNTIDANTKNHYKIAIRQNHMIRGESPMLHRFSPAAEARPRRVSWIVAGWVVALVGVVGLLWPRGETRVTPSSQTSDEETNDTTAASSHTSKATKPQAKKRPLIWAPVVPASLPTGEALRAFFEDSYARLPARPERVQDVWGPGLEKLFQEQDPWALESFNRSLQRRNKLEDCVQEPSVYGEIVLDFMFDVDQETHQGTPVDVLSRKNTLPPEVAEKVIACAKQLHMNQPVDFTLRAEHRGPLGPVIYLASHVAFPISEDPLYQDIFTDGQSTREMFEKYGPKKQQSYTLNEQGNRVYHSKNTNPLQP